MAPSGLKAVVGESKSHMRLIAVSAVASAETDGLSARVVSFWSSINWQWSKRRVINSAADLGWTSGSSCFSPNCDASPSRRKRCHRKQSGSFTVALCWWHRGPRRNGWFVVVVGGGCGKSCGVSVSLRPLSWQSKLQANTSKLTTNRKSQTLGKD